MTRALLFLLVACSESSAPAAASASPVVKCSLEAKVRCDCDSRDSPSGTEIACSRAALGEPALCCSDEGFAKDESGGCSCVAFACERAGLTCRCGPSTSTDAERVASCAPGDAGQQCCVDATKRRCVCSAEPCNGTAVPDCTLERIGQTCEAQFTTYRSVVTSCRD